MFDPDGLTVDFYLTTMLTAYINPTARRRKEVCSGKEPKVAGLSFVGLPPGKERLFGDRLKGGHWVLAPRI